MKKALVIRWGAFGDCIIITPALKKLKELGYHVIMSTSQRGMQVFKNNPNIDEFIEGTDNEMSPNELLKYWDKLEKDIAPDKTINFSESIECSVAIHPVGPLYNAPKKERAEKCNKNYYDFTAEWAGLENCSKLPELFFTQQEAEEVKLLVNTNKFNILWCMSGSGKQKVFPWTDYVIGEVLKTHKDIHFITIGDEKCQMLETLGNENITNLSGVISMRQAMHLTRWVDLVVSPDTGILHASGCYETPKIALLGHTTAENITKHFKNVTNIEADCECSPCFRLIYNHQIQCPVEPVTGAAWCMAEGIDPRRVYDAIERVYSSRA